MSHLVDAHVAYIKTISDLNQDKAELLERIKRLEEMYEGVIGEKPELLGSNVMGLLKRELTGTQKRIKELEALNNQLCDTNVKVSQECDDLNVRVNKLEEENGAMRADLLLWKYQLEEERGKK